MKKGDDAHFIYPSNYYGLPKTSLKHCFEWTEDRVVLSQYRSGRSVRNFVIYRLHGAIPGHLQRSFYDLVRYD